MDSGRAPNVIGPGRVAFARNVTFRGGFPRTRPGWRKRPLAFADELTQAAFEDGLFQGAFGFDPFSGGQKLVASLSGRIFRIDVDSHFACSELTGSDINSPTRPKAWFEQAEDFLIIQDNESTPFIYNGTTLRRVSSTSIPREVPVGNVMLYANGRLWVTRPSGKSFVAGNIVYGEDGTAPYQGRDSVLKFTESNFLNGGGEFGIPFSAGSIRSMRAIANLDTSLGQGPIQVFTERGAFSVNAPFDRTTWQDLQYPIQTVSLLGAGAESHEATTLVNGDIWFRSSDGIRSFQIARRDQGTWVNTPMSSEMQAIIDIDDVNLLDHASAVLFDNRYLMSAAPYRATGHGVAWRGLIALDFDNVSGIGIRTAPVYDGFWTGLNILQIVPSASRCFLFTLNANSKVELWELSRNDPFDHMDAAVPTRISSYIDTPSFTFPDGGWDRKELTTGDLWYDDLVGTVDFTVQFRPDQYPVPIDWHTWSVDSKNTSCLTACSTPASLQPQYRPRMRLPLPPDSCDAHVNSAFRYGFEFSCRIAWTGHGRLKRLRLVTHEVQEDTAPFCEPSEPTDTTGVTVCDTSLFGYSSQ